MKFPLGNVATAIALAVSAFGTAAQTRDAPAAAAEVDNTPPIPEFLQGFTERQLRSKPIQRFLFNYNLRANVDGTLPDPPGARMTQQFRAMSMSRSTPYPYVLNSRWTALGPLPITGGQVGNALTTRPMSGRVSSLAVHPTDTNRWLVGTAAGGVWETRDGGANFVALTDAAPTLAVGAVAYARTNPNIIYVGTGEGTFSGVSFGGEGILKSTDGGTNWQQLGQSTFVKGTAFASLVVDPGNANVLLAATTVGIFGRPGTRPPSIGAPGLWRSTDGGVTWTQTLALDGISIVPRPDDFSRLYAGMGASSVTAPVPSVTTTARAVQRSTDGGVTWTDVPGPWTALPATAQTRRTEIAIAPSNPNRVYVAIQDRATSGMHGLWTSDDAWAATPTWTQISLAPTDNGTGTLGPCGFDKAFNSASAQCWYNMTLTVKPTDENMLFFGGIPVWRYERLSNTWTEVSQTAAPADRNNGIHVDQHASTWAGSRLIMGNDGGVWSTTTDGTGPWTAHNATLATAQYYEGSVSSDASSMLGGSQDNGTHRRTGSNAWPLVFGGDGAGNLSSTATNFAVSSQNQGVARTTNGGASFTSVRGNYGGTAPFIGKMRECAAAPGTVALNGSRINITTAFYTGASGSLWTNSGAGIFTGGTAGSSIAFGSNCNTIAAGHGNGEIRITNTGTITPAGMIERDPGNQVPNRPISSVVFDPNNATGVCVGIAGVSGGAPANLYCTSDYTAATPTWNNRSLPVDVSVNSVIFDPAVANRLYAGADYGVWTSADGGATWAAWGPGVGMPNSPVFDLVHAGGKLFAFTHGRGAFVLSNFDLNNDAAVNCTDVAIVKAAMGKKVGDVGYSALADLNSDNVVNVRDLSMITRQLPAGTSCP